MTTSLCVTTVSLLQALVICIGGSALLVSCRTEVHPEQPSHIDSHEMISDSLLAYDPETYEEIVVIYSMPAHMKGKRGSVKDNILNNTDKLSIDTVVIYEPEKFRLKRWQITATAISGE